MVFIIKERFDYAYILIKNDPVYRVLMKKSLLKYPKTEKEFTILKVHKYPLTEETNMASANLIKKVRNWGSNAYESLPVFPTRPVHKHHLFF
jgi:hypothetical protein